jgi:nucleotide-binding universal stress UspA family protein
MNTPVALEHDEMGRLVGVRFESAIKPERAPRARWLVAIDGSAHALKALDHVLKMAEGSSHLMLDLINVEPWVSKEASQDLPRRGWAQLVGSCERLDHAGVPWRAHVVMGEPAPAIIAEADAINADAVVIGSRGHGAVGSLLLGSVARDVLETSKASVWVVR